MSHRRLVLACALTVIAALVAAITFTTLAVAAPAAPVEIDGWAHTVKSRIPGPVDWSGLEQAIKDRNDIAWFAWFRDHPVRKPVIVESSSPRPAPVPSGTALEAIARYFPDVYASAVGVARCESSLDPGAVSPGGGNWGLFQVNRDAHEADFEQFSGTSWEVGTLNADLNAAYARKLYDGNGWGPWACAWAA